MYLIIVSTTSLKIKRIGRNKRGSYEWSVTDKLVIVSFCDFRKTVMHSFRVFILQIAHSRGWGVGVKTRFLTFLRDAQTTIIDQTFRYSISEYFYIDRTPLQNIRQKSADHRPFFLTTIFGGGGLAQILSFVRNFL